VRRRKANSGVGMPAGYSSIQRIASYVDRRQDKFAGQDVRCNQLVGIQLS
jgi:hypothetical protein